MRGHKRVQPQVHMRERQTRSSGKEGKIERKNIIPKKIEPERCYIFHRFTNKCLHEVYKQEESHKLRKPHQLNTQKNPTLKFQLMIKESAREREREREIKLVVANNEETTIFANKAVIFRFLFFNFLFLFLLLLFVFSPPLSPHCQSEN